MSSLKRNIVYNFMYQILILFLPFITAPYLSRTIGANGIGTYSFSQSITLFFTYITMLGLSNYGNRSIAMVQDDIEKRSKIFWEIYLMQISTFVISIVTYIIYISIFSVDKVATIIMIGVVISSAFDINWFFFGMEKFKITVTRNAIIKLLSVVSIFIFIHNPNDIYKYILIMTISTLLSQFALWPYLKKFIVFKKVKWIDIKKHYKPNLVLFIPVIAVSIYKIIDKIMLGYMTDMTEVGYYENAEKIITMIESLIVAIGTVMLPRMTSIFAKNENKVEEKYFDISINAVIIYVWATIFGIIAIKDVFTQLYFGDGFEKTAVLLGYLAITIFFFGIGNVLRTQYLIPHHMDKIYINSAILGAIVNVLVNIILIPKYNSIGAAIGTICAEISVCLYQFYKVRNEIKINKYLINILYFFVSGGIMLLIIKYVPKFDNLILLLIENIIIGGIIYVILIIVKLLIVDRNKKIINEN